ncbi:MAG: hypothetical protein NZ805_11870 [Armatimonadetes bacterium]|nr:hypothetical protein [Armatimonadota bacterium]MDW8029083.1 hypothetical protein [Armatimonadota bacterium]
MKERILHQCWELIERRFYDQWMHGALWCAAGIIGLAAASAAAKGWSFVSMRLALAAIVLGVGLSFLKALSLQQMVQKSPHAFLSIFAGKKCKMPVVKRYAVFLGLMEGGFVLVECIVLFGLLGLSTTAATIPMNGPENWSLAVVLWVYGFFALTFGSKNMATAFAWSQWLRTKLESSLNWQGSNWLLASGEWTLTKFNLLRPEIRNKVNHQRFVLLWRSLLLCLILTVAIFALTLAALTLSR